MRSIRLMLVALGLAMLLPLAVCAQAPTPVLLTDQNGNQVTVTGSTTGTQVGNPTPVVLTDKNGNALVYGSVATSISGTVTPTSTPYNAKFDVHWGTTPTFTSGSNIVSCTDCNFTATDVLGRPYTVVGQIAWGSTATNDITMGTSVRATPECLIQSVDSNTQVHLGTIGAIGTACNATQNTTGTGRFIWGDLDSASSSQVQSTANDPLFSAWTAASNACAPFRLPAGATFIEQSEFVTYPTGKVCGGANSETGERFGFSVTGAGVNATFIIPTPNFLASTCTGPNSGGVGCLLTLPNPSYADFTVYGGGNTACGAGFNGKTLVQIMGDATFSGTNGLIKNVKLLGWCANTAGTKGLVLGSGTNTIAGMDTYDLWVENFGCSDVVTNDAGSSSNQISWNGGSYWSNSGCAPILTHAGTSTFKSSKSYNGTIASSGQKLVSLTGGGVYISSGDILIGANSQSTINFDAVGGIAMVSNDVINSNNSNTFFATVSDSGTVYASSNNITIGSGARLTYADTSSTLSFYDLGGNKLIFGGSVSGNGPGALNWYGKGNGDTFHAVCTGTATSSSTLGLFGSGPNETLTTCTSTTIGSGLVMQNAGKLINLIVTATHAGVNASSGVVTVLKNGATQTMTCTIGTGTTCSDAVHQVSYVTGDLISIQFTTQTAEVLAGVNATIVAN